jgi:hypothetical protein
LIGVVVEVELMRVVFEEGLEVVAGEVVVVFEVAEGEGAAVFLEEIEDAVVEGVALEVKGAAGRVEEGELVSGEPAHEGDGGLGGGVGEFRRTGVDGFGGGEGGGVFGDVEEEGETPGVLGPVLDEGAQIGEVAAGGDALAAFGFVGAEDVFGFGGEFEMARDFGAAELEEGMDGVAPGGAGGGGEAGGGLMIYDG